MEYHAINDEVLYGTERAVRVSRADVEDLKDRARRNARQRVRLCTHPSPEDPLHQMVIVHSGGTYVPPHLHRGRWEIFHVLEGLVELILLTDEGVVQTRVPLGPYDSGRDFYYRIPEGIYHTLLIHSEQAVFLETTTGPFEPARMTIAPWAPTTDESADQQRYLAALEEARAP